MPSESVRNSCGGLVENLKKIPLSGNPCQEKLSEVNIEVNSFGV